MGSLRRIDARTRAGHQHWGASKGAESQYTADVLQILATSHRAVLDVVEREHLGRADANTVGIGPKLLQRIVTWQAPRVRTAFDAMAKTADAKTLKAAKLYGVNVRHVAGVESTIAHSREENVALIKDATEEFLDQVGETLDATEGLAPDEIRKALESRVGVSNSRGALIARDQTLKTNAAISHARMRSAGVSKYTWSGSLDERERPMHAELEGEVFAFDDPPVTNPDGDRNNPGEDFQCRCVAIPLIEDLEEPDDEEPGDEEPESIAAEE